MREMGLQVEFGSWIVIRDWWFAKGAGPGGGAELRSGAKYPACPKLPQTLEDASRDGAIHHKTGGPVWQVHGQ